MGGKAVAGCLNGLDIEIVLSLNRAGDGDDMALLSLQVCPQWPGCG